MISSHEDKLKSPKEIYLEPFTVDDLETVGWVIHEGYRYFIIRVNHRARAEKEGGQ